MPGAQLPPEIRQEILAYALTPPDPFTLGDPSTPGNDIWNYKACTTSIYKALPGLTTVLPRPYEGDLNCVLKYHVLPILRHDLKAMESYVEILGRTVSLMFPDDDGDWNHSFMHESVRSRKGIVRKVIEKFTRKLDEGVVWCAEESQ